MKQVNVDAEWMALHALTCSPNPAVRGYLFSRLKAGHFKYEVTHPLFTYIAEIAVRTGAVPSIQALFATPGLPQAALQSLGGYASSHQPVMTEDDARHIVNVLDIYRKTRLVYESTNLTVAELEGENADLDKIKQNTEKLLIGLGESEDDAKLWHFGEGSNSVELFTRVMSPEREPGIKTGFKTFDDKSGGFKRGNFVGIASHFKGGKSMVSYRMGLNQYEMGYNVLYLPLEMSDEETMERHLSSISGVEANKIRTGQCSTFEMKQITKAYQEFEQKKEKNRNRFSVQALPSITPTALLAQFRSFKYDVIYCDYINLMEPSATGRGKMNDAERLNVIGREMKQAASALGSVLVGLTQLDEGTGDLRYSKALKEHANNVWKWKYQEAERATGVITVEQMAARSWDPFPFNLKVDYARVSVVDAPEVSGAELAAEWNKEVNQMEGMFNNGW